MKLLIFGASGATGILLVQQALQDGHMVTAFVRNAGRFSITHKNLSVIVGNVKDFDRVLQAVNGHDAILSALGAEQVFSFDPVVVTGLQNITNAMAATQVNRLVYLSTLGVSATRKDAGLMIRGLAPTILSNEIKGHELREKIIYTSPLDWTILRAPILTNGAGTKKYRTAERLISSKSINRLSRADVAHCMLAQVTDNRFVQKALSVMP